MRSSAAILVFLLFYCALGQTIYFQENGEYGPTFTDAAIDSGASTIPLRINSALNEWSEKGGAGLLENGNPARRDYFFYKARQGNKLIGVTGVDARHPEGVEIVGGGHSRWSNYTGENPDNDTLSAIHDGFGMRFVYPKEPAPFKSLHQYMQRLPESKDIYVRFYLKVDAIESSSEPLPYAIAFHALEDAVNSKILVVFSVWKERDSVLVLKMGDTQIGGVGLSRKIEYAKATFVEYGLNFSRKDSVSFRVWVNNQLIAERTFAKPAGIDVSRLTLSFFRTEAHMKLFSENSSTRNFKLLVDDVVCADTRLGPPGETVEWRMIQIPPRQEKAFNVSEAIRNNYSYRVEPLGNAKIVSYQWEFCKDFVWGLPLLFDQSSDGIVSAQFRFLNFPNGELNFRNRVKTANSDWSAWKIQQFNFSESNDSVRPVVDSLVVVAEGAGEKTGTDSLRAGVSYDLYFYSRDPKGPKNLSYTSIILSHSDFTDGNVFNKGGVWTEDKGYYISLATPNKVFIKTGQGSDKTKELCSDCEGYVNCKKACFVIDTVKGFWKTNFKIGRHARPGTWFIMGTMFNRQEIPSVTYLKKIVVQPGELFWWEKRESRVALMVLAGLLIGGLSALWVMRMRRIKLRRLVKVPIDPAMDKIEPEHLDAFIKGVVDYIDANFKSPDLSRESIAKTFQRSNRTLSTHFNDTLGVSIPTYINRLRCEEAKKILVSEPGISIKEIAFRVGFANAQNFATIFKSLYGYSPSGSRK